MEIVIFNEDDRLNVAKVLVKNGYTVKQGKRKKTPNGKTMEYFLVAEKEAGEDIGD